MIRARAIAMMSCLASTLASGTEYPSKPIRLVVPYAACGSTDTVARIVGQQLRERVGQQVVIDNRTGAGTILGTEIAAQAAPDGYTLLMATPPLAVNPALYDKVPYDLERDFAAVTNVASGGIPGSSDDGEPSPWRSRTSAQDDFEALAW